MEDTIQEFVLAIWDVKVSVFFDVNKQKCNPEKGCSLHSKWENCYSIPLFFWHSMSSGSTRWAEELMQCTEHLILLQPTAVVTAAVLLMRIDR